MTLDPTALIVGVLAAIPGAAGALLAWRAHRDGRDARTTEFGTKLAGEAFASLKGQVDTLAADNARHAAERDEWEADRARLLAEIATLTGQLHRTNNYLAVIVLLLDQHGITRPPAPSDLFRPGDPAA